MYICMSIGYYYEESRIVNAKVLSEEYLIARCPKGLRLEWDLIWNIAEMVRLSLLRTLPSSPIKRANWNGTRQAVIWWPIQHIAYIFPLLSPPMSSIWKRELHPITFRVPLESLCPLELRGGLTGNSTQALASTKASSRTIASTRLSTIFATAITENYNDLPNTSLPKIVRDTQFHG